MSNTHLHSAAIFDKMSNEWNRLFPSHVNQRKLYVYQGILMVKPND
jgi:hypothetical protein